MCIKTRSYKPTFKLFLFKKIIYNLYLKNGGHKRVDINLNKCIIIMLQLRNKFNIFNVGESN